MQGRQTRSMAIRVPAVRSLGTSRKGTPTSCARPAFETMSPAQPDTLTQSIPFEEEMDSGILQRRLNAVERPSIAGYSVLRRLNPANSCHAHTRALSKLRLTDAEESPSGSNLSR